MACRVLKFNEANSNHTNPAARISEYGVCGNDYFDLVPGYEIFFSFIYYPKTLANTSEQLIASSYSGSLGDLNAFNSSKALYLGSNGTKLAFGSENISYTFITGAFYEITITENDIEIIENNGNPTVIAWDNINIPNTTGGFYFGFPYTNSNQQNRIRVLNCALCNFRITNNSVVTLDIDFGRGYPTNVIPANVGSDVTLVNFGSRIAYTKQDAYLENDACCVSPCGTYEIKVLIKGISLNPNNYEFTTTLSENPDNSRFSDCTGYSTPQTESDVSSFLIPEVTTVTVVPHGIILTLVYSDDSGCDGRGVQLEGNFYCAEILQEPKCCHREINVPSTEVQGCCVELTAVQAKEMVIQEYLLKNFGFEQIDKLFMYRKIGSDKYNSLLKALTELLDFSKYIQVLKREIECSGKQYTDYITDDNLKLFINRFMCHGIDIKCLLQMSQIGNFNSCCEEKVFDTTCPCEDTIPKALPTRYIQFNVNDGDSVMTVTENVTFTCCSGDTTVRTKTIKTDIGVPTVSTFNGSVAIGSYTMDINFDSDHEYAVAGASGEINVVLSICGQDVTQKFIINVINTCVDEIPNPLPLITIPQIDLDSVIDNSTAQIDIFLDPFSCCTNPPENPAEQTWEITNIVIPSNTGFFVQPNVIGSNGIGDTVTINFGFNKEDSLKGSGQIYIYLLLCGKYTVRQDVTYDITTSCEDEELIAEIITEPAPPELTFSYNTSPGSQTIGLNIPDVETCCSPELNPFQFVALEQTSGIPLALYNLVIITDDLNTNKAEPTTPPYTPANEIVVQYDGHSASELVGNATFVFKLTFRLCGVDRVVENVTINFIGNCLTCGDINSQILGGAWGNSSEADDVSGELFDFSLNGTFGSVTDLETFDLGETGKHVIVPFYSGATPDGLCVVSGYPTTQTAPYSSALFSKKDTIRNSTAFDLIGLTTEPLNTSKHGVGRVSGLTYNGGSPLVVTNDFYTNTSGILFIRNLSSTRYFSVGKMVDADLTPGGTTSLSYLPICISKTGLPDSYPTENFQIGEILNLSDFADISDNLVGNGSLATFIIVLPTTGLYNFTFRISGVNAVANGLLTEENGIGFYGRSVNVLNSKTCIAASGFNSADIFYVSSGLNYQDAWARGLMNIVDLGPYYSFPPTMNGIMLGNDDVYTKDTDVPKGTAITINEIDGLNRHFTEMTFNIKAFANNSLFVLNIFSNNTTILSTELAALEVLHTNFKIELLGNSYTP